MLPKHFQNFLFYWVSIWGTSSFIFFSFSFGFGFAFGFLSPVARFHAVQSYVGFACRDFGTDFARNLGSWPLLIQPHFVYMRSSISNILRGTLHWLKIMKRYIKFRAKLDTFFANKLNIDCCTERGQSLPRFIIIRKSSISLTGLLILIRNAIYGWPMPNKDLNLKLYFVYKVICCRN